MVAVLKRKKIKSPQHRFLSEHRRELKEWLGTGKFPARSPYFDRYRRGHQLFQHVQLQGQAAITEGVTDARDVAVEKSLTGARGPMWHASDHRKHRVPKGLRGVDHDSDWGCSQHDSWVQGYSFEVVVSATQDATVFPLLASAGTASAKKTQACEAKGDALPASTENVSADSSYDSNHLAERIEWTHGGQRTRRRFLCPENRRGSKPRSRKETIQPRDESHRRRLARRQFYRSRRARAIYRPRGQTVEPFHEWFKSLFELEDRVWHCCLQQPNATAGRAVRLPATRSLQPPPR